MKKKQYYIQGDAGYFHGTTIFGHALNKSHPSREEFDDCHFTKDPTQAKVFGSIEEAKKFLGWGSGCKIMEILQNSGDGTHKDHAEARV